MNNQDDTFRRLKRSPIDAVHKEVAAAIASNITVNRDLNKVIDIIEKHHWTYSEYVNYMPRPDIQHDDPR